MNWRRERQLDKQTEIQLLATLEKVRLVADEQIAQKLIEIEKFRLARARVKLHKEEGKDMCTTLGCREAVVGTLIFSHCGMHFSPWERQWFEQGREAEVLQLRTNADHLDPIKLWAGSSGKLLFESGLMQIAKSELARLLTDAKASVKDYQSASWERHSLLPRSFHHDLRRRWESEMKSAGIVFPDPDDE